MLVVEEGRAFATVAIEHARSEAIPTPSWARAADLPTAAGVMASHSVSFRVAVVAQVLMLEPAARHVAWHIPAKNGLGSGRIDTYSSACSASSVFVGPQR